MYAPRNDIGNVDYSLDAGVAILDYFDTLFGVQYPLPKLGILFVLVLEICIFIQQNTRNSELRMRISSLLSFFFYRIDVTIY